MTPEELAKYHAAKVEREKADEAKMKEQEAIERQRIDDQNNTAERALESAVSFLTATRAAMGSSFEFNLVRDTSNKAVGINLRVDNANAEIKKSPHGDVSAKFQTRSVRGLYDEIRNAGDITDRKLGELIKTLIDG